MRQREDTFEIRREHPNSDKDRMSYKTISIHSWYVLHRSFLCGQQGTAQTCSNGCRLALHLDLHNVKYSPFYPTVSVTHPFLLKTTRAGLEAICFFLFAFVVIPIASTIHDSWHECFAKFFPVFSHEPKELALVPWCRWSTVTAPSC